MRVVRFYVSKPASFSSSSSFLRRTSTASSRTGPPQLAGLPRIRVFPAGPQPWAPDVEHMAEKCQVGCQRKCQYRCHKACQIGCQNRCQIECQNRLSDRMPDQNLRRLYHIYFQVICQKLWQMSARVGVTRNKVIVYVIFRCLWLSPVPPWFSSFFHGVPNARWFRSIFHGFIVFLHEQVVPLFSLVFPWFILGSRWLWAIWPWFSSKIRWFSLSMVFIDVPWFLVGVSMLLIDCSMVFIGLFVASSNVFYGFHWFLWWFSSTSRWLRVHLGLV